MDDLATLPGLRRDQRRTCEPLTGVAARRRSSPTRTPATAPPPGPAARAGARPVRTVQHHHAHIAAVMAEHGLGRRRAGDRRRLRRHRLRHRRRGLGRRGAAGRLQGVHAGPRTWPTSRWPAATPASAGPTGWRWRTCGPPAWRGTPDLPPVRGLPRHRAPVLAHQLETGLGCVPTSSMGRLFDAVSSLVGRPPRRRTTRPRRRSSSRGWPATRATAAPYRVRLVRGRRARGGRRRRRWCAPSSRDVRDGAPAARGRGALPRRGGGPRRATWLSACAYGDRARDGRAVRRRVRQRAAAVDDAAAAAAGQRVHRAVPPATCRPTTAAWPSARCSSARGLTRDVTRRRAPCAWQFPAG